MGTYLNPGKAAFAEAVNSRIHVDKTEMIAHLNSVIGTKQKYVSVSRPRRFGKTMAVDMLCAYYGREAHSRGMFEERLLARHAGDPWDRYLGQFDVIRLVMTKFVREGAPVSTGLARMQRLVGREPRAAYPDVDYFDDKDLLLTMDGICSQRGTRFVILIDEWDAVFRTCRDDMRAQGE